MTDSSHLEDPVNTSSETPPILNTPVDLAEGLLARLSASGGRNIDLLKRAKAAEASDAEATELNDRMATILRDTANALKGEPGPTSSHSWHDLAEVAAGLMAAREGGEKILRKQVADADRLTVVTRKRAEEAEATITRIRAMLPLYNRNLTETIPAIDLHNVLDGRA